MQVSIKFLLAVLVVMPAISTSVAEVSELSAETSPEATVAKLNYGEGFLAWCEKTNSSAACRVKTPGAVIVEIIEKATKK